MQGNPVLCCMQTITRVLVEIERSTKSLQRINFLCFLRGRVETDGGSSQLTGSGICGGKKRRELFFIFPISYF